MLFCCLGELTDKQRPEREAPPIPCPLGRQLRQPAPDHSHYYNHSYEGDGENRVLRRMDESLRREQKQNTRTTGMEGMNERMDGTRNPNDKNTDNK